MKRTAFILCAALALMASGHRVSAAEDFDPAALPGDKASLEKLADEQLRDLRREVRACNETSRAQHNGSICVMSSLDSYIRQYGSPALKALHFSLSQSDRYNESRWPNALDHLKPAPKP